MASFFSKFQDRQNDKFERKVRNSIIIKSKTIPVKKLHLISDEKRTKSIVMLLLTIAYSVIAKLVVGDFSIDFLVAFNVVMFLTDLYLRLNDNSVWALNHYSKISAITMINRLSLLLIFMFTTAMHIEELLDIMNADKEYFDQILLTGGAWEVFLAIFAERPIFTISFAYSVISFIPVLFFFIKFSIKMYARNIWSMLAFIIPIFNIFALIKWVMAFRDFKEYVLIDEETCQINYRRLSNGFEVFYKAILRIAFIIGLIVLLLVFSNTLSSL